MPERERVFDPERGYSILTKSALRHSMKNSRLMAAYGMTLSEYRVLYGKQEGLCAICAEVLKPGRETNVDHCHATGRVRGLLCQHCNRALGGFRDSVQSLLSAVDYLGRNTAEPPQVTAS